MAYDEGLAQRMRAALAVIPIDEKNMFGGIGFLLNGNMACGVNKDEPGSVRVGPDAYEDALAEPHTKEFDMTGRPMRGWGGGEACGLRDR